MTKNAIWRGLKAAAIFGEILVLTWLCATESVLPVIWVILIVSGIIGLTLILIKGQPLSMVLGLIIGSAAPRLALTLSSVHVRPEHLIIGLVAVILLMQLLLWHFQPEFNLRAFDCFLLAYIVLNFITSAVYSPDPSMTLRWAALNAIVISPYFLIRVLVKNERALFWSFNALLLAGAAEASYGLVCFISNHLFATTFGITTEQYGALPGTYGTQYEANLFGSYSACCAVMYLAAFIFSRRWYRSLYALGFAVTFIAALISLSRAALLAFPIAALFVLWVTFKKEGLRTKKLLLFSFGTALILLVCSPFLIDFVVERFSTIDVSDLSADSTTMVRLITTAVAVQDVRQHPVLGTGTASFQLLFDWDDYLPGMQSDREINGWIGNTPLRILHDTGVIGLIIFTIFLVTLTITIKRALSVERGQTRVAIIGLSAGLILYGITFQATEATMLAFTWVHVGLLATAVNLHTHLKKTE